LTAGSVTSDGVDNASLHLMPPYFRLIGFGSPMIGQIPLRWTTWFGNGRYGRLEAHADIWPFFFQRQPGFFFFIDDTRRPVIDTNSRSSFKGF
jgi:hypothetical protein